MTGLTIHYCEAFPWHMCIYAFEPNWVVHLNDISSNEQNSKKTKKEVEITSSFSHFNRIEEKLKKNMRNDPDDECEAWLLGNGEAFSAADISLGVILNRLALLGLRYIFWEGM